jgi:tRNA(Arg) A34 adenosine deaminase TadA
VTPASKFAKCGHLISFEQISVANAATLYSTLQPYGMCTMASIRAKVGRFVYGAGRNDVHRMYFEDRNLDTVDFICDAYRDDLSILPALLEVINRYRVDKTLFRTFVVLLEKDEQLCEEAFEQHLWERIQSLSEKDDWLGFQPDPAVDSHPHFGLSFGGEAFFIVGLHPGASRPARQLSRPAMVFNLHDQFEVLRNENKYERMRAAFISRPETRFIRTAATLC